MSPSSLPVGSVQSFLATGIYSDGSKVNITAQVNWTSSDPYIAVISSAGLADALSVGNTNITASLSGITSPAVNLDVKAAHSVTTQ